MAKLSDLFRTEQNFIDFLIENYYMEEKNKLLLTNREVKIIQRYKERIREIKQEQVCDQFVHRDTNTLDFYKITPKEELPKFLQKMRFQTLHLKQKEIASSIKIFKKENRKPLQSQLRKKLREEGQIMLLSQIYQNLGEQGASINNLPTMHTEQQILEQPNQLDEWQKQQQIHKHHSQSNFIRDHKENSRPSLRNLREASDYRGQMQRGLEIIEVTHGSESNLINRYTLIQNSSKLLKKELDDKKLQVQENIKNRMKLLYQARTQYHNCFEQRNRLRLEERFLKEQAKEDLLKQSHKSIMAKNEKGQKRSIFEANEVRIARTKKTIESLEEAINNLEQELRKILNAEKEYYKITLKNGTDVRESGLVWVIRKLQITQAEIGHYEFPSYLDRRSKLFLVLKAKKEQEQEILLQEKRKFVNQIGKVSSQNKLRVQPYLSYNKDSSGDKILQTQFRPDNNIPKKYRKSLRKMSALAKEFVKNSSLFDLKSAGNRNVEISNDLQGLSHKQMYMQVGRRIKRLDLNKIRRQKLGSKGQRLMQYQSLLEKIKAADIQLEDMDLQHENYLLAHNRQNKNHYFMQAAACFGYKRAYSMIIKHFSWKNYIDHLPKVVN